MDKHLIISATNAGELTEECFMENNLEKIEKGERTLLPLHRNKKFFMCGGFDLTDEQGRHIGAILSLANITGHVINVQNANNAILRIAIILFFVIFAAGLLISRSITRPILRLVEVAKAISKGDLDKRVHVSSGDEIGLLGNTFNEMIQKRKLAEEKLGNSRNELEIRVNTRTAELTAANKKLQHEITERRRIEDELLLNHKRLEAIKEIGVMATSTLNLKGVLRRILEGTLQATGAHIGMIFLMDKNTGDLSWGRRWR
jgi:methyl-accepting chemotaxis protein